MRPRTFFIIAWLPLALLLGLQFYARQFEGWGRWAVAPLFLAPLILSVILVAIGISVCRREAREGRSVALPASATLASAIPALWFLARALAS
jgi:hypothetical protein